MERYEEGEMKILFVLMLILLCGCSDGRWEAQIKFNQRAVEFDQSQVEFNRKVVDCFEKIEEKL